LTRLHLHYGSQCRRHTTSSIGDEDILREVRDNTFGLAPLSKDNTLPRQERRQRANALRHCLFALGVKQEKSNMSRKHVGTFHQMEQMIVRDHRHTGFALDRHDTAIIETSKDVEITKPLQLEFLEDNISSSNGMMKVLQPFLHDPFERWATILDHLHRWSRRPLQVMRHGELLHTTEMKGSLSFS
jgi:hypothetical protein